MREASATYPAHATTLLTSRAGLTYTPPADGSGHASSAWRRLMRKRRVPLTSSRRLGCKRGNCPLWTTDTRPSSRPRLACGSNESIMGRVAPIDSRSICMENPGFSRLTTSSRTGLKSCHVLGGWPSGSCAASRVPPECLAPHFRSYPISRDNGRIGVRVHLQPPIGQMPPA